MKCGGCGARQDVHSRRELAGFENGHEACGGGTSLDGTLEDLGNLPEEP